MKKLLAVTISLLLTLQSTAFAQSSRYEELQKRQRSVKTILKEEPAIRNLVITLGVSSLATIFAAAGITRAVIKNQNNTIKALLKQSHDVQVEISDLVYKQWQYIEEVTLQELKTDIYAFDRIRTQNNRVMRRLQEVQREPLYYPSRGNASRLYQLSDIEPYLYNEELLKEMRPFAESFPEGWTSKGGYNNVRPIGHADQTQVESVRQVLREAKKLPKEEAAEFLRLEAIRLSPSIGPKTAARLYLLGQSIKTMAKRTAPAVLIVCVLGLASNAHAANSAIANRLIENPMLFINADPEELKAIAKDQTAYNTALVIADSVEALAALPKDDLNQLEEVAPVQPTKALPNARDLARGLAR